MVIDDYIEFLSNCKTERECVDFAVKTAIEHGFELYDNRKAYGPGDKVYFISRDKNFAAFVFGKNSPLVKGVNLLGAHIDSPRLDIKCNPLYEKDGIAYFDTQYYGGIKKYQWTTIPLAIHGVVFTKDGRKVNINIGENPIDPVFCISDLLPHLDRSNMSKKNADDFIPGEKLDIIAGTEEDANATEKDKDKVKLGIMNFLKKLYKIEEADFYSAELEVVPAGRARYCALDSSLIAGYGQDDRVCVYTSLMAIMELTETPNTTSGVILVDKEEIGSTCASGAKSRWFEDVLRCVMRPSDEISFATGLYNSNMLSSDVTSAFDPMYADAFDKKSSSRLGKGMMISKYNGGRGKSGGADASPEYIAKIRCVLDKETYQFDTMGKVDQGGGGTIASIISALNINVVDAGVPLLNMHSPMELVHKNDVISAFNCYTTFIKNM